jgi:uncharacterized lipoprotein YddW (UPF0748 family)
VRGAGDAFYDSAVEPWAKSLTGTLGKDPGWDPLQVAIEQAHSHGLELHAWLNTFPAWSGSEPPPASDPPNLLFAHPDWRMVDKNGNAMAFNNSYTWVSPGIPGVRQHIIAVVLDILSKYDVDGIHMDYIRYAGPDYSHDQWSEEAWAQAVSTDPSITWGAFQRGVITSFVAELYIAMAKVAPQAKLTASVWGIYQNNFGWSGVSQGYYDYYQDSHEWLQQGALDAICPMVYWPLTNPKGGKTDYATLADDHFAASAGRHVYMGLKVDYSDFGEIAAEIDYLRLSGVPGYVAFSYSGLVDHGYGPDFAQLNAETASVPPMPWKP